MCSGVSWSYGVCKILECTGFTDNADRLLRLCAHSGHVECVQYLYNCACDIHTPDTMQRLQSTIVTSAVRCNQLQVLQLAHQLHFACIHTDGIALLQTVVYYGHTHLAILEYLYGIGVVGDASVMMASTSSIDTNNQGLRHTKDYANRQIRMYAFLIATQLPIQRHFLHHSGYNMRPYLPAGPAPLGTALQQQYYGGSGKGWQYTTYAVFA